MRSNRFLAAITCVCALLGAGQPLAASTPANPPAWMRSAVSASLPEHDEKTEAVLLYSETIVTVQAKGKTRLLERKAYRILRKEGERYGIVSEFYSPRALIRSLRGWSLRNDGTADEARDKDIADAALDIYGGELVSDARRKILRIPGGSAGAIVGYEVEHELLAPLDQSLQWNFQGAVPVRQARYTLVLPPGWTFKTNWMNHSQSAPDPSSSPGETHWSVSDVKPIELEAAMPPLQAVVAHMALSLQPPGDEPASFQSWQQFGNWYLQLTQGRDQPSAEMVQKARELTAAIPGTLGKIETLAGYVQKEIRYVAIELGIGGFQPHAATEIFGHRYGDCKDKVTLLAAMLNAVGVRSHYVIVNSERGAVTAETPPNLGFDHVVIAIELPNDADARQMPALVTHEKLGRLLFFDPTDEFVPIGTLPVALQMGYGVLVSSDGGELLRLPGTQSATNGIRRTGKFQLDVDGSLRGDVTEVWMGQMAANQRSQLRAVMNEAAINKLVESRLALSLSAFELQKASVDSRSVSIDPLEWHYTFAARTYAKTAGGMLLVRPRVLGVQANSLFEDQKNPRRFPIEFIAPGRNTDVFEIAVPAGYVLQEAPPRVEKDLGFIAYSSHAEMIDGALRYTRSFEVREVSVAATQLEALKQFYRDIETDERAFAMLAPKESR